MKKIINFLFLVLSYFLIYIFLPAKALAICPVCTVAVGAGLGLSRWLGVDDTISGIWIGALLASIAGWTINWLEKKNIKFVFRNIIIIIITYAIVILPLYRIEIIGHPLNKIYGIDKLMLGTAVGTIIFVISVLLHNWLKSKNDGKSYFNFQKIVIPISLLLISSAIFYFLT